MDGLFAILDDEGAQHGRAIDRLEYVMRRSVDLLVRERPHVTLLLRVRGNTQVERQALDRRREFQRTVTKLVLQAKEEGDIVTEADEQLVARLLFGMINSIAEWQHQRNLSAQTLADTIVHISLAGLRPRQSAA
jgi:hypothetical protein